MSSFLLQPEFTTLSLDCSVEEITTPEPSALSHDLNSWNMAVYKVTLLEKGYWVWPAEEGWTQVGWCMVEAETQSYI